MRISRTIRTILGHYDSANPGVQANLCRILMHGKLGGTGRMVILPVDQGFEHGPDRSFASNVDAYDPHYHHRLAVDAGLSAYAAPLGMLATSSSTYAGAIPTILKLNSSNSLMGKNNEPTQAITGSVQDALALGCSAVGYTIYPGSDAIFTMLEDLRDIIYEAKAYGLPTVVWSYPRGGDLTKEDETALDVCAYAAHMAALAGAHIIKVKPPSAHISHTEAKKALHGQNFGSLDARIRHVVQSCFAGRRLVIFSGGANKGESSLMDEIRAIHQGGGNGSIIGRNVFQRPKAEALLLLKNVIDIYKQPLGKHDGRI